MNLFYKIRNNHPLPSQVRKPALLLVFLAGWLLFSTQAQANSCPEFNVNLTGSPTASWTNPDFFVPSGQCCNAPLGSQCFSYEVSLHPGANAVVVNLSREGGTWGLIDFYVNCLNYGSVYENQPLTICLDGPGPHTITFCRTGPALPSFKATITGASYTPNVSLEPFSNACTADGRILLTGGYPTGGRYYINGTQSFWLEPGTAGPGTYEVTYVYSGPSATCAATATQTITVNQTPTVTASDISLCNESGQVLLTGATPEGGEYLGRYISANLFNTDLSGTGAFDFTYQYISPEGCPASEQAQVIVNPLPPADAGINQTVAQNTSATLAAINPNTALYGYSWSPAAQVSTPNQPTTNTLPLTQSQMFTLTVTNLQTGCQSTDQTAVYVSGGQLTVAGIYPANNTSICQRDSVYLFVLPSGGSGHYLYSWYDNSDLSTVLSNEPGFWHTPAATITYRVEVLDQTNPNGRPATRFVDVDVAPLPLISLEPFTPVCGNETFYPLSGASPAGGYFSLPIMGIHDIQSVNPQELGTGYHTISYTVVEGNCRADTSQYLQVFPRPEAKFYAQQDFCATHEATFLNLSKNTDTFVWQIGTTGAPITNPPDPFVHVFDIPLTTQNIPVTLTASQVHTYEILDATHQMTCSSTRTRLVEVIPPTVARLSVEDQDLTGCAPYPIKFSNKTTGPVAFYIWDFGDGSFSTQAEPMHTFTNHTGDNITYTVKLTAMSGNFMCVSQDSIMVTVKPFLQAGFGLAPITSCSPYEAEIFNNAQGLNITQTWNFGDGSPILTSSDPVLFKEFLNNTLEPQDFLITQIVTNTEGCADTMEVEITIYPFQQSGFTASIEEGCAPLTVSFTDASAGAAFHYFWDFADGGTSDEKNPVHTFENKTDQTIFYEVMQVTSNNNFCSDTTIVTIEVHPEVKADFNFFPEVVCAPHQANVINTSTGNISSYSWALTSNGVTTPMGTEPEFVHTFHNPGPDPIHYILSLNVENSQRCSSQKQLPITVNPEVTAMFEPSRLDGCQPLTIDFTNQSTNGHVFVWNFGDGGSSSAFSPEHTFENLDYSNSQFYNVSLYVESDYLCSDTYDLDIELFPAVEALFTVDTARGCSPFEVDIAHFSKGATLFSWDFGDGSLPSAEGGSSLTHTYVNTTNQPQTHVLRLEVENGDGCNDVLERIITVYPEVEASFVSITEGCHPLTVQFSNQSENAHYFNWQFGTEGHSAIAQPAYTFTNSSHTHSLGYNVSLTAMSVYGCSNTMQETITVRPVPNASFVLSDVAGCTPFELEITNNAEGATSHYWTFGDGGDSHESGSTLHHTYYLAPGNDMQTFNIQLEVSNEFSCTDSLIQQLTLYPQIVSDFEADILEDCHPLTVQFTNLSEGASAHAAYFWNYGDGFESVTGENLHSHTFLNHSHTHSVTYTVELLAMNANACSHTKTMDITVLPAPLTTFSISDPAGCSPHNIMITNHSQGGTSYEWNLGDSSPSFVSDELAIPYGYVNPAGNGPATFTISLTGTNNLGCTRSFEQSVLVYPEVEAAFSSETEGCQPLFVNFTNETVGATYTLWNFGEGNNSQQLNPSHLFLNHSYTDTESFVVTLYSENNWGCHDSTTDVITVWPLPLSNFDLQTRSGCSPFTTNIFNLSEGASSFEYDLGNGTFSGSDHLFSHTWSNTSGAPLQYQLWLSVENEFGCEDHSMQSITVYPEVEAAFATSDGQVAGCSPFEVQFVNQSQLTQEYVWDFGNGQGTAGANPWHSFTNQGPDNITYTVEMAAKSLFGCKDTTWLDITVYPTPVAKFDATPKLQVYPSRTITLNNLSKPGYWNYDWSFGDGNGQQTTSPDPFDYTYAEWNIADLSTRSFTINLEVENQGCADTYSQTITITSPVPEAHFSPNIQGCAPFEVQFYNQSLHAHSYFWTFGDGSFSINEEPRHLFVDPGLYEVQMVAYGDGGTDTTYRYVTVHPNPVADFALVKPLIEIPYEPLEVINKSVGADFYHWDFGDGSTSTEFEPVHWYEFANTYTITLAVATDTQPSCRDTLQLKNALLVQESCRVVFPNAFTPQQSGPHGGACDPFDLENTTFEVFYPKMEGIERYELEIFNRWGELIFRSTDPYTGWDGYYRGRLATLDVYVWKFKGICVNGQAINLVGDVTLLR